MQKLTPRELQIARLIERGLTYEEMAAELGTAVGTVKSQTRDIRLKLGGVKKRQIPDLLRQLGISF